MASNSNSMAAGSTLGEVIHCARLARGLTFKGLAEVSGVAQGQISKLEHDQVLKPNPAHLAALAEPLGLTIYRLYAAAGYSTPSALTQLGSDLEEKLSQLSPEAVNRLDAYLDLLSTERGLVFEPASEIERPDGE